MAGGAQARALACGAAGMPDGGRAPVAGRIDAQRRPEEASAGVSCLPRPSDIFETRADFLYNLQVRYELVHSKTAGAVRDSVSV